MSRLWQTSGGTHAAAEAYTVGDDPELDGILLPYDLQATDAHAAMLVKASVLTAAEYKKVSAALDEIKKSHAAGTFQITREQEDGHTAIEQCLTDKLGDTGKKIHTGRSRNDQSLVMLRLYMKDFLGGLESGLGSLAKVFTARAKQHKNTPMPGYTHLQKAMPTTVGAWLGAYGDAFADLVPITRSVRTLIDQNPLGSAAGFGVKGLKIDREHTAGTLGFAKVQDNPLYAGLSRGYFELALLQVCSLTMTLAGRFASDMLLFTTQEFGYFSLPPAFTTGSSIMPNKRNYDIFEVMRGNAKLVDGYCGQVQAITGSIGGGYQRDLALTKGPFLRGTGITAATVGLLVQAVSELQVHEDALKAAMTDDLYATEKVYDLVAQGVPFRDAYKQVKEELFPKENEDGQV
jgi:argininosuccinate lyase